MEIFSCTQCKYKSGNKKYLHKHIKNVHERLKTNLCKQCDFGCNTKKQLRVHELTVHNATVTKDDTNLLLKCKDCDYKSYRRNALNLHIQSIHIASRSHKCEKCGITCNQKSDLTKHIKRVHQKLMLWLSKKKRSCDSNYSTFRLPRVHSLNCPSTNFFLFFCSPSKNFFLFSMKVF